MKKAKAIELLKLAVPIKALTQQEYADFVEAVNMGMDALEQPTSPDTIDRKAALDALRRCQTYLYDTRDPELKIRLSSADAAIKELPTIQPEKAQLSQEGTTKDTTSDLISRQAAIDALARMMPRSYTPDGSHPADEEIFRAQEVFADCIEALEILPSAQPERKKGEWLPDNNNAYEMRFVCSCCKESEVVPTIGFTKYKPLWDFCPNCGADMRGEKDG